MFSGRVVHATAHCVSPYGHIFPLIRVFLPDSVNYLLGGEDLFLGLEDFSYSLGAGCHLELTSIREQCRKILGPMQIILHWRRIQFNEIFV